MNTYLFHIAPGDYWYISRGGKTVAEGFASVQSAESFARSKYPDDTVYDLEEWKLVALLTSLEAGDMMLQTRCVGVIEIDGKLHAIYEHTDETIFALSRKVDGHYRLQLPE